MKRLISIVGVVVVMVLALAVLTACGDTPHYYISDVVYDPSTGILDWSDNSDATEWLVTINGKREKTKSSQFEYQANNESFSFRIEGLHDDAGSDINPVVSDTMYYLEPATNLRVQDGCVRWDPSSGASYYQVYNNGGHVTDTSECYWQLPAGSFNIVIKPGLSGYYYTYDSEAISGCVLASPTTITYQDGVFTWDAVSGADFYEVTVNGTKETVTTNSYAFAGNKQDIEISVAAGSNAENSFSSAPLTKTCYYLTPLTAESYSYDESGNLIWPAVANAAYYQVKVNGVDVGTVTDPCLTDIQLDTPYTVEIVPMCDFGYTDAPISYSFEKLSPVTNIRFADGVVAWDAHGRAQSYELVINGEIIPVTGVSHNLGNIEQTITIEVYALGSIPNSRSYMSSQETYTYLPRVTNVRVQDGVLTWDASEGAAYYALQFSNETITVEGTSYDAINPNQQYIVKVMPRNDGGKYYSYWTGEFTFSVLAAPYVRYDQGIFRWDGSNDASGYTLRISTPDGNYNDVSLTRDQYLYRHDFTVAGQYFVSVKLNADPANTGVYDSKFSTPVTVYKLADVANHTIVNSGNTDTVQISVDAVTQASGYKVMVNGSEVMVANSNTFSLDLLSLSTDDRETTFNVSVQAIGQVAANNVVLDSTNPHTFNVIRLATPTNVRVNGNLVTWDNVNNASKYMVVVDGQSYECNTSSYQFLNLPAGNHVVKVQAINRDSAVYVPGRYSADMTVTKLIKPANVRIEPAGSDVLVKWEPVSGALGYQIKIDGVAYDATTTAYKISSYVNSLQPGHGIQISVYAKGDGGNVINSEPSDTVAVTRLLAPDNISISGDNIVWNESSVDGIRATSYILYLNGEEHPVSGTSFSVAGLEPGTYNVAVKALGNNTTTLDSTKSATITVTKLPQVTNIVAAAGGTTYTWDPVAGTGVRYSVTIGDQEIFVDTPSFNVVKASDGTSYFTSAGEYKISIRAISNDPYTLPGDVAEVRQVVRALQTPTQVSSEAEMADYKFMVTTSGEYFYVTVDGVDGLPITYDFIVDGMSHKQSSPSYSHFMEVQAVGFTYNVQVKLLVSCFGADGVYYIDSNPSAEVAVDSMASAQ